MGLVKEVVFWTSQTVLLPVVRPLLMLALLISADTTALAASATQDMPCERDYIVRVYDSLSKFLVKFYGDNWAYPTIIEATIGFLLEVDHEWRDLLESLYPRDTNELIDLMKSKVQAKEDHNVLSAILRGWELGKFLAGIP